MRSVCPCCAQTIERPDPGLLMFVHLGNGMRRTILDYLIANFGKDIPVNRVVEHVYAGVRDGGPNGANECVHVAVSRLRRLIAPFGFRITGGKGQNAAYRLEWAL